jgi:uncharacterized RDD family membrane protein YckC/DNA-directed RNA polymerase subunit RPC12/RpoP
MVRCMRCGKTVDGYAQMCDDCAAEKRAAEAASMQQATSTMTCPWCGATMLRSAPRCSACFREWADYRASVVGMGGVQRGDFWIRLVAWFIDTLIVGFISTVGGLLISQPGERLLFSVFISILYPVSWWVRKGATPGKLAMGLRVVDMNGNKLTVLHAIGRYFSYILSAITLGIGYLMIFGEEHMGLHDRVSSSQVVFANTLPKEQAASEMQPAA